jgi:hypothetical protein
MNFIFTGATTNAVVVNSIFSWVNCEFNNSINGMNCLNYNTFVRCEFLNNSTDGCSVGSSIYARFYGCIFSGNGRSAVTGNGINNVMYRCLCFNHGSTADVVQGHDDLFIMGCTFDGDGTSARIVDAGSESIACMVDCVLYDAAIGYYTTDTTAQGSLVPAFIGYNLTNSLTTGAYRNASADLEDTYLHWALGDVTSAPAFTDEASDDYTLGDSSPAIDAGIQPGGIT